MKEHTMSDTTSTDVAIVNPETGEIMEERPDNVVADAIARLQSGNSGIYSSLTGTDFESRLTVLNAVQSASPLVDEVNRPFILKNVVIQQVQIRNNETNRLDNAARVILLTGDNRALYAISKGILSAVINFIGLLGQPAEWPEEGVPVVMNKEKATRGNVYVLRPHFGTPKK